MPDREPTDRRWLWALVAVGAAAAAARAAVAVQIWDLPHRYLLNADAAEYHRLALIVAGLSDGSLPAVFGLSPLATLWGAVWHSLFGPHVAAVVAPQILLGTGTVLLAAASGRRLAGKAAGIAAGLLTAICEPLIVMDAAPLATSLAAFLSALTLWACLWASARCTVHRAAILGLCVGAWIACRPNAALFLPIAAAVVATRARAGTGRGRLVAVGALLLATALPVTPITAANAARGGVFVPVTWSAGINLFIGNNQGATGRLESTLGEHSAREAFEIFTERAERVAGRDLDPAEVSRFWTAQTWREIRDDPARFAALLGRKLIYGVNDLEVPDSWCLSLLETEIPILSLPLPGFGIVLSLGLIGLAVLWRRGPPGRRAAHGVVAVSFATMLIFFVVGRYRIPAIPALAAAAGAAIAWIVGEIESLVEDRPRRERRASAARLASASLLLAVAATVSHLPILHPDLGAELFRLARAHAGEGRRAEEIAALEKLRNLALIQGDRALVTRAERAIEARRATMGEASREARDD